MDQDSGRQESEQQSQPVVMEAVAADSYEWLYSTEAGVAADGPAVAFASQESAEGWLSEHFQELLDSGVAAVSLSDGSRVLYGPMPLDPG